MLPEQSEPLISIVIPTLNSGKLLRKALLSVNAQTLAQFEVIVVDAGSIDDTKEICNSFGEKFKFHCLKKSRQGEARNFGISKSQTNLIMFLDSDDQLYDDKVLEHCLEIVAAQDCDIYNFAVSFEKTGRKIKDVVVPDARKVLKKTEIMRLGLRGTHIHTIPWNKIYKKKFLIDNGVYFPNLKEQEDMVFTIQCCVHARSVFFTNRKIVRADVRDNSLSRNMTSINVKCCLDVFNAIEKILKEKCILELFQEEFNIYKLRTSSYIILMAAGRIQCDNDFWNSVSMIKNSDVFKKSLTSLPLFKIRWRSIFAIFIVKSNLLLRLVRQANLIKFMRTY